MMTIFLPKSADLAGVSRFQVGDEYLGHLVQSRAQIRPSTSWSIRPARDFFSERLKHFVIGSLSKWAILDMCSHQAWFSGDALPARSDPVFPGLAGHQSGCEMLVEEHLSAYRTGGFESNASKPLSSDQAANACLTRHR
jgi:hypothetical protein